MRAVRMLWFFAIGAVIVGIIFTLTMPPKAASTALKAGDKAPDFSLPDQEGRTVKLADYHGKNTVVLAFYVKANTPG